VAIVSAIMAADDPKASTEEFARLIKSPPLFALTPKSPRINEAEALIQEVPQIVRKMVEVHPLVHNMINFVVVNFVANVALSMYVSIVIYALIIPLSLLLTMNTVAHRLSWLLTAKRPKT